MLIPSAIARPVRSGRPGALTFSHYGGGAPPAATASPIRVAGVSTWGPPERSGALHAFNYSSINVARSNTFGAVNDVCHVCRGVRTNGACLEPRVIAKAPPGEGCPRCGGYVYAAEQMLARGKVCTHYDIHVTAENFILRCSFHSPAYFDYYLFQLFDIYYCALASYAIFFLIKQYPINKFSNTTSK